MWDMADGTLWPIASRECGVSILCDANRNPLNGNVLGGSTKSMMNCGCFFISYFLPTGSERWSSPILTQPVCMFGMMSHDILDGLNMLIWTGMPGIQSQRFSVPPFAPCQRYITVRVHCSVSLVSHIIAVWIVLPCQSALVRAMFIGAGIVRQYQTHTYQSHIN